ncbi:MAG: hypothetical protein RSA73_02005 [Anaerovoracaceae bacterium]
MKNYRKWMVGIILILITIFPVVAFAMEASIITPSDQEGTISPGRNFYIIGQGEKLNEKNIKVELIEKSGSRIVRTLTYDNKSPGQSDLGNTLPAGNFHTDIAAFGSNYNNLCMPDLICNPLDKTDSSVKITATEENFAALILGGKDNGGLKAQGDNLAPGEYTIKVTITLDAGAHTVLVKDITLGNTADKIVSRFSPDNHKANVDKAAKDNGYRIYNDPFPGYWSPSLIPIKYQGKPLTSDAFLEIWDRWKTADAQEYATGNVHFYIYNVKASSATQAVEMAEIQRSNRVDTDLNCYGYDIGEPELLVNGTKKTGEFVAYDKGDKLVIARSEVAKDLGDDNKTAVWKNFDGDVDYNMVDGVKADPGQEIAFYGVTPPIQNTPDQITDDGHKAYTMANLISKIKYTFKQDGKTVSTEERNVTLSRDFLETWTGQQSIYEYKHVFSLTGDLGKGEYNVTAQAIDTLGNPVSGGKEVFRLAVGKIDPTIDPTDQPSSSITPTTNSNVQPGASTESKANMGHATKTGDEFPWKIIIIVLVVSGVICGIAYYHSKKAR